MLLFLEENSQLIGKSFLAEADSGQAAYIFREESRDSGNSRVSTTLVLRFHNYPLEVHLHQKTQRGFRMLHLLLLDPHVFIRRTVSGYASVPGPGRGNGMGPLPLPSSLSSGKPGMAANTHHTQREKPCKVSEERRQVFKGREWWLGVGVGSIAGSVPVTLCISI